MQETQEAAAEAEAHGAAGFRLVLQGRIAQLQLIEGLAQVRVLVGVGREQAAEHHRLGLGVTRQRRLGGVVDQGDRVANAGIGHGLDRSGEIAHLTGLEAVDLALVRGHHPDLIEFVGLLAGHQQHLVLGADRARDHPEVDDHPAVGVVIGVKDQGPQGFLPPIRRRGHPVHHGLQDLGHAQATLGRAGDRAGAVQANDRFDLLADPIGIGARQVDLVEDRNDLQVVF